MNKEGKFWGSEGGPEKPMARGLASGMVQHRQLKLPNQQSFWPNDIIFKVLGVGRRRAPVDQNSLSHENLLQD